MPPKLASPLALLAVMVAAQARASYPPDAKSAEVLFQSGRAAMNRGDLATACPQFAESQRLDPAAGTLLNLGECEARAGKIASALAHLQQARQELAPNDFRIAFADARIAGLARRVPQLTIRLAQPPAQGEVVLRDGVEVPSASLDLAESIDPGAHELVVRAPGHADARVQVTLREGEAQAVELEMGPLAQAGAADVAGGPRTGGAAEADTTGRTQRIAGLAIAGAGAAALVVGGVFGVLAKGTYDAAKAHCPNGPNSCDQAGVDGGNTAYNQAIIADVALIAGGVLAAGGLSLYFTAPRSKPVALAPTVGAGAMGFSLRGSW